MKQLLFRKVAEYPYLLIQDILFIMLVPLTISKFNKGDIEEHFNIICIYD